MNPLDIILNGAKQILNKGSDAALDILTGGHHTTTVRSQPKIDLSRVSGDFTIPSMTTGGTTTPSTIKPIAPFGTVDVPPPAQEIKTYTPALKAENKTIYAPDASAIMKSQQAYMEANGQKYYPDNQLKVPGTIDKTITVTPAEKTIGEQVNNILEMIPKSIATLYGETIGKGTAVDGKVNLGIDARRLGFSDPKYVTAQKEQEQAIANGENPLLSGLRIVSSKSLDALIGADFLASIARTIEKGLLKGGTDALYTAWDTLGKPKTVQEAETSYRNLSKQLHPDVAIGSEDAFKTISNAMKIIREQGIPDTTAIAKYNAAKISNVLGRETAVGKNFFENFARPDLKPKVSDLPPTKISGLLPGTAIEGPVQPKIGMSIQPVKKVPVISDVPPVVYKETGDLSTKLLTKLEGKTTVSKQFISDLTNSGDMKQVEKDIIRNVLQGEGDTVNVANFAEKVKAELLPLTVKSSDSINIGKKVSYPNNLMPVKEGDFSPKYEGIGLPENLRGRVANYRENLYQSPIKTSAGDTHFPYTAPNYFGHTRIEDMSVSDTRRVIEVQSDLFQKGNLEREKFNNVPGKNSSGGNTFNITESGFKNTTDSKIIKAVQKREQQLAKLQQYNDPTAHFRMVREEIKKAAQDGKTKLQFPTGETAMKIEGLDDINVWTRLNDFGQVLRNDRILSPENMKIGNQIMDRNDDKWIITEVSGGGKFKAVPRDEMIDAGGSDVVSVEDYLKDPSHRSIQESFDISGKIDTNNPIYKFYEKDLGRYLTNNYGAKVVTDAKGVKWYQVDVKPELANKPVTAFSQQANKLKIPQDKAREIVDRITKGKTRVWFTQELIDGTSVGQYIASTNPALRSVIQMFENKGMVDAMVPYHESFHYLMDNEFTPEYKDNLYKQAIENMGPLAKWNINNSYKEKYLDMTKTAREKRILEEYLANKYAEHMAGKELGAKDSWLKSFFEKLDAILKKVKNSYNKIKEEYNAYMKKMGGSQKGSADFLAPLEFNSEKYVQEQITKRETAKGLEKLGIKAKVNSFLANAKAKLVDFASPIEDVLYDAIKKDNLKIAPEDNIHNQIDRVLRSPTLAGQFAKDNGIVDVIKNVDNLDALDQYLIAKHAIELNKQGIVTGRNITKDALLVEQLAPKYEKDAKVIAKYSQKLLDYSVESGLISKDLADALKVKYPDYVPFSRVFNELEKTPSYAGGKGVASLDKQSVVQKIVGSKRQIESPIESLLAKTNDAFKQGEKNIAGKMLAGYEKLPGNPFQLKDITNEEKGNRHTISFIDNGEKKVFETTPEIKTAAKALNVQQLNILGKIFALPVRVARVGITGINLPFIGANIAKDQISAFINSDQGLKTSILNPSNFLKSLMGAVKHDALYQEMVRAGGAGTSFDISRNQTEQTVKGIRSAKDIKSKVKYLVTNPSELLKAIEDIIGRGEELTRLQQYAGTKKALMDQGMSEKSATVEAARMAREATVNFGRRGEWGTVLNSAFLYLNASIQGTRTLLRTLKTKPVETAVKIVMSALIPVALATAWNLSDEKRRKAYEDIGEFEKENNIIIVPPNPTQDEQGRWNVIKIPLSQEINNLVSAVRKPIEQAYGLDNVSFRDFASALLGTVSPINPTKGSVLSTVTPQAIKPSIEAAVNSNLFTGFPIVSGGLENLSPEKQVKPSTSKFAIELGGMLGVSPIQIDAFVRSTFGGVGSQITGQQSVTDAVFARFGKAQGGAVSNKEYTAQGEVKQKLADINFEMKKKVQPIYDQAQKLIDEGKTQAANDLVSNLTDAEYEVYKNIKSADKAKQTAELKRKMIPVYNNVKTMSAEDAQKFVNGLTDEEYKAYESVKKDQLKIEKAQSGVKPTFDPNEVQTSKGIIDTVVTYAKAIGADPVTSFNRIFTGQRIRYVANGTIVVERMPLAVSQDLKKEQGGNNPTMKLDHTIPLELGGSNDKSNLKLITTATWSSYTPVENALGEAVRSGQISKSVAQSLISDFKNGLLTAEDVYLKLK